MMDSVTGTITAAVSGAAASGAAASGTASAVKSSRGQLDQGDFLRLLTTQLKLQDPTDPVDNKDMLAQMAQFSSLSGITEMNATLRGIAARLDAVLATPTPALAPTTLPQE